MSDKVFSEGFELLSYISEGDTIRAEHEGFTLIATIHRDDSSDTPWENSDGHGPVSDWTSRKKEPGERVLSEDRGSFRYYDFAEAVKIAKRDGWGVKDGKQKGESAAAYAARAAESDFKFLRSWCQDEWFYVGVSVNVERSGVSLATSSLWGIEANYPGDDFAYLTQVAEELASEALEGAKAKLEELCCKGEA